MHETNIASPSASASEEAPLAAAVAVVLVDEELQRSLQCIAERNARQRLMECIDEGLSFFAGNERVRRTFCRIQQDVNSRAPSYAPKSDDWDYQSYFISRSEWERKNPYAPSNRPPGIDTSTVENPALDYYQQYMETAANRHADVSKQYLCNPVLAVGKKLREVQMNEKRQREALVQLADDFTRLVQRKLAR